MPEDKNFQLNKRLDEMTEDGMKKTNSFIEMWQTSLRYFFGDQLQGKNRHKNWDWVVVNYIWPTAMQELAKLSKNQPRIIVHPWEESDIDVSEVWQSKLQWDWQQGINNRGMRLEQMAAILDGKLFGYRVSKVYWEDKVRWNDQTKEWEGDVKYRLWHPANFWASDDEKIDDGNCGTARYVRLDWAINRWPEFEDELKLEAEKFTNETGSGTPGPSSSITQLSFRDEDNNFDVPNRIVEIVSANDKMSGKSPLKGIEVVKIEEIYFRDYTTKHIKETQPIPADQLMSQGKMTPMDGMFLDTQTQEPITPDNWPEQTIQEYDQPLYPNGRFIIRCGTTILNSKQEEQVYEYSRWPFVVTPHYLLPHMWQGVNAVELYKSPQDMINISVSHLFNNMKMFGDPKIAVENDAIAINPVTKKHYKIGAGAGAIIRLVRGGLARFRILDPPANSAGAVMLYNLFVQEFKNFTGIQDIAMGKRSGRMTATESNQLSISAYDRIALQAAYEDEWIRNVALLDAEISQKKLDIGRFVRIVGENDIVGIQQITQKMKDVRMDIAIAPGSYLPFDEEKRQLKYTTIYRLLLNPNPNPFLENVLRVYEIPDWKKVLARQSIWQKWTAFLGLYQQVKKGKIDPQIAIQILIQEAMKEFAQNPPPPQGGQPPQGENTNAG